ncbi:hypothetical protein LguiB_029080 [Lonicera macranthoides]
MAPAVMVMAAPEAVMWRVRRERKHYIIAMNRVGSSSAPRFKLPTWATGRGSASGGSASVESQRGSSSSISGTPPDERRAAQRFYLYGASIRRCILRKLMLL